MSTKDLLLTDRDQIRNALSKSKEDVMKDIQIMRNWFLTQKHLPEIPTDNMIEFFLTNCKFSIEKTKQNMDMYYTARQLLPDMYHKINPCVFDLNEAYSTASYVTMPKLTPSLHRISILKYKNVDSDKVDIRRIISHAIINIYEIRIHEDLAVGEIYVIDCEQMNLGIVAKINPMLLKQCAFILEKVHSYRVKAIHFIKAPNYFNKVIALFKSLLNKKISERVYVHQTTEELNNHIPLELLSCDYGGKEKSMDELEALWKQKVFEYKDRFDLLDKMKINEELRPEKLKNDELLGYYGNFKTIETD